MARNKPFYIVVNPVGSKFAKELQGALQEKVDRRTYRISTDRGENLVFRAKVRRKPGPEMFWVTRLVRDKVYQFQQFDIWGVSCPKWTTDPEEVEELGKTVFARTLVNSTGGRGIVEFNPGVDPTPRAPLYTEYIPKKAEYRIHVFNGEVIDAQQKRKKRSFDSDTRDTRVRNLHNGYVYCRDNLILPEGIQDLAIKAVDSIGYKYGAVDIIYNEKRNMCYVLEVNSRPGLMGTTLDKYSDAIVNAFNLVRK